jgi:hypothetical protein
VLIAQLVFILALTVYSSFIAFYIAAAYAVISRDSSKFLLILRYALKTSSISTSLFRLAVLFSAFTTI